MEWQALVPLVGLAFAPLLGWLVSRRTKSGRIGDTDADTLWEEANRMRETYREEASILRAELAQAHGELEAQRHEVEALRAEIRECRDVIRKLRREVATLRRRAT